MAAARREPQGDGGSQQMWAVDEDMVPRIKTAISLHGTDVKVKEGPMGASGERRLRPLECNRECNLECCIP